MFRQHHLLNLGTFSILSVAHAWENTVAVKVQIVQSTSLEGTVTFMCPIFYSSIAQINADFKKIYIYL